MIPAGPGETDTQLDIIRALNVTGYTGVPGYLMTLIERAEERGWEWQVDTNLQKAFLVAEPFPPSLRQRFRERESFMVKGKAGTFRMT